jgi:PAS domain S-box-containing protein
MASASLDHIDAGYLAVDAERRIIAFNAKAEALTGLSRPAVLGRPCFEVFADWRCRETCPLNQPSPVEADCSRAHHLKMETKEGAIVLVRKTVRPLTDGRGRVGGLAETLIEQTASGAGGQHQLRLVLDSMNLGVFTTDREGRITFFNQMAEQITGLRKHLAVGRTCREVLGSTLCDTDCPLTRAIQTGRAQVEQEAVFVRQDGRSVVPVSETAVPLLGSDGSVRGAVGTFRALDLSRAVESRVKQTVNWEDFIGQSPRIKRIFEVLRLVAPTSTTILIEGPTGVGKDLLSRIIHHQSPRRKGPLVKVNCAALPETLLESEMFGYVRGAFTGAEGNKPGRFELADRGTIFLDEIGEVPLALQAKLLRVIEDQEYYPLGARQTTKVDVRILAATNQPLLQQVEDGRFREDLYFRLNVVRVYIPPLKERREDIPLYLNRFIQRKNIEKGTFICRVSERALEVLLNYDYPGNVRELDNILEHACLLCQGDVIQFDHLPLYMVERLTDRPHPAAPVPAELAAGPVCAPGPGDNAADPERARIIKALADNQWQRRRAADALGVDRTTLWRWMKRFNIGQ